MSEPRRDILIAIAAVVATVHEVEPHGAPGGILYMALSEHGVSYHDFTSMMATLVRTGVLAKRNECYFIGPTLKEKKQ